MITTFSRFPADSLLTCCALPAATGLVLVAILVILNLLVRRWLRPAQGVWQ